MDYQQHTAHELGTLRFLLTGPAGTLELRITPTWAVLLVGDEAEVAPGEDITTLWRAAGCDDQVIWAELRRYYEQHTTPAPAEIDPAARAGLARLRELAEWADIADQHGTPADRERALWDHAAELGRVIRRLNPDL